jgi:hypothetical protein
MSHTIIEEYRPGDNDVIYYYCSAETFKEIMSSKTLWLCDVKRMNDCEEIVYGQNLLFDLMGKLNVPVVRQNEIRYYYNLFLNNLITLSVCFSESCDILSQWRGYANDASGFCIGFNAKKLLSLFPFCPLKVVYDRREQEQIVMKKLNDVLCHLVDKTPNYEVFIGELLFIFAQMKHPSFTEEKEIRMVHNMVLNEDCLLSESVKEDCVQYKKCLQGINFRIVDSIPSPYVIANFLYDSDINPVEEVIVGPKNKSSEFDVRLFLRNIGFSNTKVCKYDSPYKRIHI